MLALSSGELSVQLSGTKPQQFLQDGGHGHVTIRAFTAQADEKARCFHGEPIYAILLDTPLFFRMQEVHPWECGCSRAAC